MGDIEPPDELSEKSIATAYYHVGLTCGGCGGGGFASGGANNRRRSRCISRSAASPLFLCDVARRCENWPTLMRFPFPKSIVVDGERVDDEQACPISIFDQDRASVISCLILPHPRLSASMPLGRAKQNRKLCSCNLVPLSARLMSM